MEESKNQDTEISTSNIPLESKDFQETKETKESLVSESKEESLSLNANKDTDNIIAESKEKKDSSKESPALNGDQTNPETHKNNEQKEPINEPNQEPPQKEFEDLIIKSYLSIQSQEETEVKQSEIYLSKSLSLLIDSKTDNKIIISFNKNVLDKLSRIAKHNILSINIIIGKIYINLFHLDYLLQSLKTENLLLPLINEAINLRELLDNTSLTTKYNRNLSRFLNKMNTFNLNLSFEQKESFNEFIFSLKSLNEEKKKSKPKINFKSFKDMVDSLTDEINNRPSLYDQYLILTDNKKSIIEIINKEDISNNSLFENYISLAHILITYFYNKYNYIYYNKNDNDKEIAKFRCLYNDIECENIYFINEKKYYIYQDEEIEDLKSELIDLILVFVKKFSKLTKLFPFQYYCFILLKRLYMSYEYANLNKLSNKQKTQMNEATKLLCEITINLCSFKKEENEDAKQLIQFFLNSNNSRHEELINLMNEKINSLKSNNVYDFESNYSNIISPFYESVVLLNVDLKFGVFNTINITAGKCFSFYIELEKKCNIFSFIFTIEDKDINFTIENVTNNNHKEISNLTPITCFETPYKFVFYNSEPAIYKITFDNTYSWFNSKNIKFKYDILYPENEGDIFRTINLIRIKSALENESDSQKIKNKLNKIVLFKANNGRSLFNCENILNNIKKFEKLEQEKCFKIINIFSDKVNDKLYDSKGNSYTNSNNNINKIIDNELENTNNPNEININNEDNPHIYKFNFINIFDISYSVNKNVFNDIHNILGYYPKNENEESIFIPSSLSNCCIIYDLFNLVLEAKNYDFVIHLNYFKEKGYMISAYRNGELLTNLEDFEDLNKNVGIEGNMKILYNYLDELFVTNKSDVDCFITSNDLNEVTCDKICEELDKINEHKENIRFIKKDINYLDKIYFTASIFNLEYQ